MRAFTLLLITAGTFALMGCPPTDEPTDPPDGDADTDADTDTDTDTDADSDTDTDVGDDIASAYTVEFDEEGDAGIAETIGEAGDRDFYYVAPDAGTVLAVYIASYVNDPDGEPDTVLRLYDADGNFLGENDDHPYWSWGTDSAMFFQAYDEAGYYVEVLEWGDWAEGYDPSGGTDWDYELYFQSIDLSSLEWGTNDSAGEAEAVYEEAYADLKDDLYTYINFFGAADEQTSTYQLMGEIEAEGDEDWWVFEVDSDSVGYYLRTHFFNDYYGMLDPVVTVYDPLGELVAQSTDPAAVNNTSYFWGEGGGCTFRLASEGYYYIHVTDAGGAGGEGAGYFYPLTFSGPWYFTSGDIGEIESNHPIGLANTIAMSESSSTPGYFFGSYSGALDSIDDESDNFKILADDVDGLDGKYLSVYVETALHGSNLDAVVTVYEDTGGATFEELTSVTVNPSGDYVDDPAVFDLELESDNNIYIEITHETGGDEAGTSHFYFLSARVYDSPINE